MNVPTIEKSEKRFNEYNGLIIPKQVDVHTQLRHPMDRLCDSLDLPIIYLGKYAKESREARLITYCIILGKKLRILWPKYVENIATLEFLNRIMKNKSNSIQSLVRIGDFTTYCVFLEIMKSEREVNIIKMSFRFRSILEKLRMIQASLVQYSRSNLGIFEQFKRISVPNFDEVLMSRVKLSDCEKSLAERIHGIIRGFVSPSANEMIFLSWKEYFEKVKRKRRIVREMIPPQVMKNIDKERDKDRGKEKDKEEEEEEEEVEPPSKKRKIVASNNMQKNESAMTMTVTRQALDDDASQGLDDFDDEDEDDNETEEEDEDDDKIIRTRVRGLETNERQNNFHGNVGSIIPPPPIPPPPPQQQQQQLHQQPQQQGRNDENNENDEGFENPISPLMTQAPDDF